MRHSLSKRLMLTALGLLWLPAAAFCWNAVAPWQWKATPLIGVQLAGPASSLSPEAFVNRSFQDSLAKTVGPSIPFYGDAVRLHNQVLYSVFGISPSPHILIGKERYLLNPAYTNAYCGRDIAASEAEFQRWAATLRGIQDMIEGRGQIFLYVLTPSKVEHIPNSVPDSLPCPSPDRHRFVTRALTFLDAAGVKHVDATAKIDNIKDKYGYEPFPKGGIHWTNLSAFPATIDIIHAINNAKGAEAIVPYEISVGPAKIPAGEDYDYANLLNVLWTPMPTDTAAITAVTPVPAQCPKPISIATVGGSFFTALGRNLSRGPCPPIVAQLFYLTLSTLRFEAAELKSAPAPEYPLLSPADVIIVEENVGILLKTRHISAFHDYLRSGKLPEGGIY